MTDTEPRTSTLLLRILFVLAMWLMWGVMAVSSIMQEYDAAAAFGVQGFVMMRFAEWQGTNFYGSNRAR